MDLDLIDEQLSVLGGLVLTELTKKQQKSKDAIFRDVFNKNGKSWDSRALAGAFRRAKASGLPVEVKPGKKTKAKKGKK